MLTWHSFLQSVMFFVRSISVKLTKKHYRSSSVLMSGAVVIAVVAFSANGFGGGGKNAMAAPRTVESLEADEEPETEALLEGSSFVTEAKIQFGLLNTGSEEKEEAEASRKAEEERRAARRIKVSDEDYQVLLRIVQAEAGVCDEKGKILVADVIINRVLSGKFPGNVKGVVYQTSQFQPVSNGRINSVKVTAETIRCVDRALDGEDYSNGALYFMNRKASGRKAGWFDSRLTYLFAHGGHEFFK